MLRRQTLRLAAMLSCWAIPVAAQQVTVSTPLIGIHDSFYEHINLGWGFHRSWPGGSWFMNFGGPTAVIPPFGGYHPANDLQFGFGRRGNGGGFHFNLAASQGSQRTVTMASPTLTLMNGVPGSIFSGSIRPFVTGLIPIVGDYPVVIPYAPYPQWTGPSPPRFSSPLTERIERLRHEPTPRRSSPADRKPDGKSGDPVLLDDDAAETGPIAPASGASSAARGDISVAEIRRLLELEEAAKRQERKRLVEEARAAERAGQLAVARLRFQQAAARAPADERRILLESAAKLKSAAKSKSNRDPGSIPTGP